MAVKRIPRETEAYQAWRQLETQAMAQGGLVDLQELQRRFREEMLVKVDALPRNSSDEVVRAEIAAFLLDVFVPKYRASMSAFRYLS